MASVTQRAAELLEWLLAQPHEGYERSFKLEDGCLLGERFLVGLRASHFSPERWIQIASDLGLPPPLLAQVAGALERASFVHLGFEGGPGAVKDSGVAGEVEAKGSKGLFKLYMEGSYDAPANTGDPALAPVLLHQAFKWDAQDPDQHAVAQYVCHPGLSNRRALRRIAGHCLQQPQHPVVELVRYLCQRAFHRRAQHMMYLEVNEAGNPRHSFDLNCHALELSLGEVETHLVALCQHFKVPLKRLAELGSISHCTLGHVSAGTSRAGRAFATVYYSA